MSKSWNILYIYVYQQPYKNTPNEIFYFWKKGNWDCLHVKISKQICDGFLIIEHDWNATTYTC